MNKKVLKLLVVASLSFTFAGCVKNEPKVDNKIVKKDTKKVQNDTKSISTVPGWLENGNYDGYNGVSTFISKHKIKNKKKLLYIAKRKAIAVYNQQKSAHIKSEKLMIKDSKQKRKFMTKSTIKSSSMGTGELVLKDTYETKDKFYVWMVMNK